MGWPMRVIEQREGCSCCDGSGWKHGREDVINDEQGIVWRDVDEECDCECHGEPSEEAVG